MKKFNVYVKINGATEKYQVVHESHEQAISLVREEVKRKKHGAILAVEVA